MDQLLPGREKAMRTVAACSAVVCCLAATAWGQNPPQVTITTPMHSVGHSFFERIGTQWSLQGPGFFVRFGGGPAVPPFGRFQPGAGLQGGVGFQGGPWRGQLHFFAGQGARTSFTTVAPSMTVTQGMPGTMFAGTWSPFVMGVVPVVGRPWPGVPYRTPLQMAVEQLSSSRGASVSGAVLPPRGARAAGAAAPPGVGVPRAGQQARNPHPHESAPAARRAPWRNDHPGGSLAALRRKAAARQQAERRRKHQRAQELFQQAQQFHRQGRVKTARAFCRAALPLADEQTRRQILRFCNRLEQPPP